MGDRVAVLKDGLLQQVDSPRNMYDRPANLFVAGFIGSPAMNLVEVPITDGGVKFGNSVVPVNREALDRRRRQGRHARSPSASAPSTSTSSSTTAPPPSRCPRTPRTPRPVSPSPSTSSRSSAPTAYVYGTAEVGGEDKDLVVRVGGRHVPEKGASCTSCRVRARPTSSRPPRASASATDAADAVATAPRSRRDGPARSRCGAVRAVGVPVLPTNTPADRSFRPAYVNTDRKAALEPSPARVTKCRQIITARYARSREPTQPAGSADTLALVLPVVLVLSGTLAVTRVPWAAHDLGVECSPPPRETVSEPRQAPRPAGRPARPAPRRAPGEGPGRRPHPPPARGRRAPVARQALHVHRPRPRPRRRRQYGPHAAPSRFSRPVCDTVLRHRRLRQQPQPS